MLKVVGVSLVMTRLITPPSTCTVHVPQDVVVTSMVKVSPALTTPASARRQTESGLRVAVSHFGAQLEATTATHSATIEGRMGAVLCKPCALPLP